MDLTIVISLVALGISIISILISLYNSDVDRRIQIEQIKGEMITLLTYRGVEILSHIKRLEMKPSEEKVELLKDLIKVAEGIVNVRQSIQKLPKLSPILGSFMIPDLYKIRNQIYDAEPIFDKLIEAIDNGDLMLIRQATDGLIERLFGKNGSN